MFDASTNSSETNNDNAAVTPEADASVIDASGTNVDVTNTSAGGLPGAGTDSGSGTDTSSDTDAGTGNVAQEAPAVVGSASGLVLWLDADDSSSFNMGAAVSSWIDRSGNGNDLEQPSMNAQPSLVANGIGGRSVVRFDGDNDLLTTIRVLAVEAFDGFVVWQSSEEQSSSRRVIASNGKNFQLNHSHESSKATNAVSSCVGSNCESNSGWHDARLSPAPEIDFAYLWNFSFNANTLNLTARVQGNTPTIQRSPDDTPAPSNEPFILGNCADEDCAWSGDLAELLLFSRALTNQERSEVVEYLTSKWSLATLP